MEQSTVNYFEDAACKISMNIEIREAYSGRGMNGERTQAIVLDSITDLFKLIALAAVLIKEDEDVPHTSYDHESFVEDVGNIRQDNMGRDSLVFY